MDLFFRMESFDIVVGVGNKGNDETNEIYNISVDKMRQYAQIRACSPFSFYFETGQGAECTNGQGKGVDVVLLESRKYAPNIIYLLLWDRPQCLGI